jgi:hypothetical protein
MSYGLGTRSYNRSTEKRQLDRERKEITAKFEASPRREIPVLLCHCRSFRTSHRPDEHRKLLSDYDWRLPEERRGMDVWEPWVA